MPVWNRGESPSTHVCGGSTWFVSFVKVFGYSKQKRFCYPKSILREATICSFHGDVQIDSEILFCIPSLPIVSSHCNYFFLLHLHEDDDWSGPLEGENEVARPPALACLIGAQSSFFSLWQDCISFSSSVGAAAHPIFRSLFWCSGAPLFKLDVCIVLGLDYYFI